MASIRPEPLAETDLPEADRVFRLAFGTFLGLPDPSRFYEGADYVRTRWRTDPSAAFAAKEESALVGSNFATRWGSVGFFGPLTVRPDRWDRGVGAALLEPILDRFRAWGTTSAGLFTFAHSPKHVGLYMKHGFWPRYLTAVMAAPVRSGSTTPPAGTFSTLAGPGKREALAACRDVADTVYEGLDLSQEIRSTDEQRLGDTVLLPATRGSGVLDGFAVCHCGAGTEAGPDACYVKFGVVRGGSGAADRFSKLLEGCDSLAAARGMKRVVAGANAARREAFAALSSRGFKTEIQGVAMQRGDEPGYNRPGSWLIDDWR